ncbi:MAG: transposase [candidate division WOR-3 bacterium]
MESKREKIKYKIQQTKEKRKDQVPTVIQCKLQNLSKRKIELLEKLFLETKWLYNWLVADVSRVDLSTKVIKEVEIKVKENFEKRELKIIGSQIKQGLQERVKQALKSLKNLKTNGNKVGKLKFKSKVNSIPLKQYGVTYNVDKERNRVRIQNLGSFRALGLRQITDDMKITNGFLVRKADGYYLHITCYKPKKKTAEINKPIAIDFGIENKVNFSNRLKIDFEIPETKRLKALKRKLARKIKGSKNYEKIKMLIQKEYLYIQRLRKEVQNKIIALAKRHSNVIFQDDNIKSWHESWFGRQVQHSSIGGITERIKNILSTPVLVVDRYQTTSKICFNCQTRVEVFLSDRVFRCSVCGYVEDRDINSARNMLKLIFKDGVQKEWLIPSEEDLSLIKRLFGNVRKYVTITIPSGIGGKLCPTDGPAGSDACGEVLKDLVEAGSSSLQ